MHMLPHSVNGEMSSVVSDLLEKYKDFVISGQEEPTVEDITYYLNFFSPLPGLSSVYKQES